MLLATDDLATVMATPLLSGFEPAAAAAAACVLRDAAAVAAWSPRPNIAVVGTKKGRTHTLRLHGL